MDLTIGDFGWAWHRLKEGERVFRSDGMVKGCFCIWLTGTIFLPRLDMDMESMQGNRDLRIQLLLKPRRIQYP